MEEYLPFVSIDTWTIIMSWGNLLILFLLLKHFLFKPIQKIFDTRAGEIENRYKTVEAENESAKKLRSEYEAKLSGAETEADEIIRSAIEEANLRSESIVKEAGEQAKMITEKSRERIEYEKQQSVKEAKSDIAVLAIAIAEKLISKKLSSEEDEKLIEDIIERI